MSGTIKVILNDLLLISNENSKSVSINPNEVFHQIKQQQQTRKSIKLGDEIIQVSLVGKNSKRLVMKDSKSLFILDEKQSAEYLKN